MPFITATSRPTSTWSVFGQSVRTNNYVEGWHCRLNGKASHRQLNLYLLLTLLGGEAALVDVNVNLVKEFQNARRPTKSPASRGRLPHFGLHLPLTRCIVKISRIL